MQVRLAAEEEARRAEEGRLAREAAEAARLQALADADAEGVRRQAEKESRAIKAEEDAAALRQQRSASSDSSHSPRLSPGLALRSDPNHCSVCDKSNALCQCSLKEEVKAKAEQSRYDGELVPLTRFYIPL